jgi:hypothetical protein
MTSGSVREFSGLIVHSGKQTNKFALVIGINRMILIAEQMNIIDDHIDSNKCVNYRNNTFTIIRIRANIIVNLTVESTEFGTEGHVVSVISVRLNYIYSYAYGLYTKKYFDFTKELRF